MKKKYTLMLALPLLLLLFGSNLRGQAPNISNIITNPENPTTSDNVFVSADVTASSGSTIDTVFTAWGTASGTLEDTIGMANTTDSTFRCDNAIPAQPEGTQVFYTVTAIDDTPDTTASSEQYYFAPTEVADIITLRAGDYGDGSEYILTGEAVITYQQSFRNKKHIQDGTAGILIDDNSGIITTEYNRYDSITGIRGTLSNWAGLLQFTPIEDPGAATSTGNTVTPEVVTINAVNTSVNDYESELIKFEGVEFIDAGGTFETGTGYDLTDGTDTITFKTNFSDANYIGNTIPYGTLDVTALVGEHFGTAQVTARENADLEALAPQFSNIAIDPMNPTSSDAVTISSDVTDNGTIDTVYVAWGITSGTLEDTIGMSKTSGDTYVSDSDIPAQATVYYEITAVNTNSYKSTTGEMSYTLAEFKTISEIQDTTGTGSEASPYEDSTIVTSGTVVDTVSDAYYIQDGTGPWNGIKVMDATNTPNPGDSVEIKAVVVENYGFTRLDTLSEYTTVSTGNDIPAADTVTTSEAAVEKYEGVYIYIKEATCTNPDAENGQWEIDDGSGAILVDDDYYTYSPTQNAQYNVKGFGHYSFSARKILPTDETDVIATTPELHNVTISPENPTSNDAVSISADITSETSTIDTAYVKWGTTSGSLDNSINMVNTSGDTYKTNSDIPSLNEGDTVYFEIHASDGENTTVKEGTYQITGEPPVINNITTTPEEPEPSDDVSISADITDDGSIDTVFTAWGTSSEALANNIGMSQGDGDTYTTESDIPAQNEGDTIYYKITAKDKAGNESSSDEKSFILAEGGETAIIDEESLTLEVYPNPGNGQYSLEIDNETGNSYNVTVFNTVGEMVYNKEFNGQSVRKTINITDQNDGIYFLKVRGKNVDKVVKLIKE